MRIEMNGKVMKEIIEKASANIDKRASLDCMRRLYFRVEGNKLEVMTHNYCYGSIQLKVFSHAIFNVDGVNGCFDISVDDVKLITKIKGSMEIYNQGEKLYIKTEKKTITIPCNQLREFVDEVFPGNQKHVLTIAGNLFLQDFENVAVFASKKDCKRLLSTVNLDTKKERMAAVDGSRFTIKNLVCYDSIGKDYDNDINIPVEILKQLKKVIDKKDSSNIEITYDEELLSITGKDFRLDVKCVPGKYFDIDSFLKECGSGKEMTCDRQELMEIMQYDNEIANLESDKKPVILCERDQDMLVYCRTRKYETLDKVNLKSGGMEKSLKIGFNPLYYVDALKIIKDDQVKIELFNSKSAGFIYGNNYTFCLLPCYIGDLEKIENRIQEMSL